jgi:hypothetical protein
MANLWHKYNKNIIKNMANLWQKSGRNIAKIMQKYRQFISKIWYKYINLWLIDLW